MKSLSFWKYMHNMINMLNMLPHWTPSTFTVYNNRSRGQKRIHFPYNREHGVCTSARATHKIRKIEWLCGLRYGLLHIRLPCSWHCVAIRRVIIVLRKFFIVAWKLIPCQPNRRYNGIQIKNIQNIICKICKISSVCTICRIWLICQYAQYAEYVINM